MYIDESSAHAAKRELGKETGGPSLAIASSLVHMTFQIGARARVVSVV